MKRLNAWVTWICIGLSIMVASYCSQTAEAEPDEQVVIHFRLDEIFDQPFRDFEKIGSNDTHRCWAKSIKNMLTFGWNLDYKEVEEQLREMVPDNVGYDPAAALAQFIKKNKGSEILLRYSTDSSLRMQKKYLNAWITGALLKYEIVNLNIQHPVVPSGIHALTVYGYDVTSDYKLYLYYVDSNDGVRKMYRSEVRYDPARKVFMFASGPYKHWSIDRADSLDVLIDRKEKGDG